MSAVTNISKKPLAVALPGGKKLHLGPGQTGQLTPKAAESAAVARAIEAGELELSSETRHRTGGPDTIQNRGGAGGAHRGAGSIRRSGDR